jgi:hypothetical protein
MFSSVYSPPRGSFYFPCFVLGSRCAIMSWTGLLEVPALCLGVVISPLVRVPCSWMVAPGNSWCQGGGSRVRSMLSLVMYPKCVHIASLMLLANCWGPDGGHPWPRASSHPRKCCAELPMPHNMTKDHQSWQGQEPRIGILQGQLLLCVMSLAGINTRLDKRWNQDR